MMHTYQHVIAVATSSFSELVSNQQGHKGQDSDIEQTYANIAMKQIIIYRWLSHKLHLYIHMLHMSTWAFPLPCLRIPRDRWVNSPPMSFFKAFQAAS